MVLHHDQGEAERIHTNQPEAYPVSGRKPMTDTPWSRQVIQGGRHYLAGPGRRSAGPFPIHALIERLGLPVRDQRAGRPRWRRPRLGESAARRTALYGGRHPGLPAVRPVARPGLPIVHGGQVEEEGDGRYTGSSHDHCTCTQDRLSPPTRERIMAGRPETGPLLALADRAEGLGYDSIWIGDSLLAKPRHDPITLMAAVAARTERVSVGSAVLLPALRNPVVLAQQIATLDRIAEGRLVLGVGIAADVPRIRAEFDAAGVPFEKRVGRMLEGLRLCRALWSGEPVDWEGRWQVRQGTLAPTPHRPGGPPIWVGGSVRASLERAGRHFGRVVPDRPRREAVGRAVAGSRGDRGGGRAGRGGARRALPHALHRRRPASRQRADRHLSGRVLRRPRRPAAQTPSRLRRPHRGRPPTGSSVTRTRARSI